MFHQFDLLDQLIFRSGLIIHGGEKGANKASSRDVGLDRLLITKEEEEQKTCCLFFSPFATKADDDAGTIFLARATTKLSPVINQKAMLREWERKRNCSLLKHGVLRFSLCVIITRCSCRERQQGKNRGAI